MRTVASRASTHPLQAKGSATTRRGFIQRAALAGAATLGVPSLLRAKGPNERLKIVIIGCGGRGASNMEALLGENIVALCDVNESNLRKAAARAPQARKFRDFRKLYDDLRDHQFDAVVVSTTEHTHAFATLPALQRKKHVYCEKPLTHNVREARRIALAAKDRHPSPRAGDAALPEGAAGRHSDRPRSAAPRG